MEAVVAALAASLVSFAVLYILLDRRIRRRVDPETILAQIRHEIEGLIVELDQTADRSLTLMEEKMTNIRSLLDEADRRVGVARRDFQSLLQTDRAWAALRPVPPEPAAATVGAVPRAPRAARKAPRSRPRAASGPPPAPSAEDPAALRSRIVSLHRAGISADSIVRRLGVPRATVDLVADLEDGAGGERAP